MKTDCPHCHKSMSGRFVQWRKFAQMDRNRNCPLCGKDIEFRLYPEEIGVRVLGIAVAVAGAYWARQRGEGYFGILLAIVATLIVMFVAAHFLLRGRQRFQRGRHSV